MKLSICRPIQPILQENLIARHFLLDQVKKAQETYQVTINIVYCLHYSVLSQSVHEWSIRHKLKIRTQF